jgi:hypothetical protein
MSEAIPKFGACGEGKLAAAAAAWQELPPDAGFLPATPECPSTYDLLQLALGAVADEALVADLNAHSARCARCAARSAAQGRAVRRTREEEEGDPRPHDDGGGGGTILASARAWVFEAWQESSFVLLAGPNKSCSLPRLLRADGGLGLPAVLHWEEDGDRWYVTLQLDRPRDEASGQAWEGLAGRKVTLELIEKGGGRHCLLEELELGRNGDTLYSLSRAASLAPDSVSGVRLRTR